MTFRTLLRLGAVSTLAMAIAGSPAAFAQQAPVTGASDAIIVTATKREENIRSTPLAVSAVTGEELAAANANSLSDYINRLPGVVFNDYQPGVSEVVIRGIAATTYHEQGQATVGYYLNEIPLVEPGFPIGIPDVDTFDIDRVEVLRGPQGTLFGSSTLGGLVNYVVKTADTNKFDAAAQGLVGYTKNADGEMNYAAKAMVNVPVIEDMLAVRLMALQRFDAGYIDNLSTGVDGSNDFRTRGLRGSVVFTPTPDTKLTYLSTWQDTKLEDQTYLDLTDPYNRDLPRAEPQFTEFWLNSLRLDQTFDAGTLTVLGSIVDKSNQTYFSYPYAYVTGVTTGDDAAYSFGDADAKIKYAEARFATDLDGMFNLLIGASYMRATKTSFDQIFQNGAAGVIDANPDLYPGTGAQIAPNDRVYGYISDSFNEDIGVFGELSVKPAEGVELILGGRYFWNEYEASVTNVASPLSGSLTDIVATVGDKEDGFTPKATLTVRPTDDVMAYMTYSRGYRVGGANPNAGLLPSIQPTYDSDEVDNYEAGIKMTLLDNALLLDATVFNIDWKGIQARLFGPAPSYYSYVSNAGSANIAGVEFAGSWQFTPFANFSTSVTYQDAKLTDFLPDTFATGGGYASGSTLPGASEWSVSNNLKFDFADTSLQPTFEIAHRYLSTAPVAFGDPAQRGDFNIFDLRASVTLAETIRVMAFANNVFDKFGVLNAPFADAFAPLGTIVRPRTVGLRVDWSL